MNTLRDESSTNQKSGLPAFTFIWAGQLISLLGTAMTSFGLSIWAFQTAPDDRRATIFSLLMVAYFLPILFVGPFAGTIVDRSNRKVIMILSDLGAGFTTLVLLYLFASGNLQIWHLFISNALEGVFQTFQWPAYNAAVTLMVDKKHYSRTSAMIQLAGNSANIMAPLLAGGIIGFLAPNGIVFILGFDIFSFFTAVTILFFVPIPQPQPSEEGKLSKGSFLKETVYGFQYILKRSGLLGLQITFLLGNFFSNLCFTLLAPMILTRSGGNSLVFGSVQTAGAIGGVTGGLIISTWGGLQRKSLGVTGGWVLAGALGMIVLGIGHNPWVWAAGMFLAAFFVPLMDSSNQAIWQRKVAPDVQGRVFSTRRTIAWLANPIGAALAGPLADWFLEPRMQPGGELAAIFGRITGTGPGTGMALIFIYAGLAVVLVGLTAYAIPAIANVEDLLPDHEQASSNP